MQAAEIIKYAVTAPSADNSQPWQFCLRGHGLVCAYEHRSATSDPFGALGHANLLTGGALLENLDMIAAGSHVRPVWKPTDSSWQITLDDIDHIPGISPACASRLLARHTNRHPFRSLEPDDLHDLPYVPASRAIQVIAPETIRGLAHAVMLCSMARFNSKELHEWLFSSIRWTRDEIDSGTGLDINTLHLPPGGRMFMRWIAPWPRMEYLNRIGLYRVMANADAALVRQAPGLIAIVSGDSPQEIVDSGRLMQRIWLELNARGVSVHPYYVLTDLTNRRRSGKLDAAWTQTVDQAVAVTRHTLGLAAGEQIQMLLRIGRSTSTPVRSRRLPVSTFLAEVAASN